MPRATTPFHILTKPIGAKCSLQCDYCFYLEKEKLYPDTEDFRMSDDLLELFVREYIAAQPGPMVPFAWQGGEPTLMGVDFFRRAVELQAKYLPPGWRCENALQTNGVLLNEEWCEFLREKNFLVGISLDGPAELHDAYRKDHSGSPVFDRVLRGLHVLKENGIEYNVLCVVNNLNSQRPLDVYNFFLAQGVRYIQFIPLVEPLPNGNVSPRTVAGRDYGRFLTAIFDEWAVRDLGEVFVQTFEECVAVWAGYPASLCVFGETCGRGLAMEHNGDVYACDHYVLPEFRRGNLREEPLASMVEKESQLRFGADKRDKLPKQCRSCRVRFICNGGCPKNRLVQTVDGEPDLNYLCAGYKQFFTYIDPYMKEIVALLKKGSTPGVIRERMKQVHDRIWGGVGRNDSCPCGSGEKYKKCCLTRKERRNGSGAA